MPSETSAIFVYGTLMTGGGREHLLAGHGRVAATVRGTLWDLPAGYPALSEGDGCVHGELVYGVPASKLALLDRYEGVAEGLYRRGRIEAIAGGHVVDAVVYVMDDPAARGGVKVASGRWRPKRRR